MTALLTLTVYFDYPDERDENTGIKNLQVRP